MDIIVWSKKNATYYDRGRKPYGFGVEIPEKVLIAMGEETFEEYKEKGWIKLKSDLVAELTNKIIKEVVDEVQEITESDEDLVDEDLVDEDLVDEDLVDPILDPVESDVEKLVRLRDEAVALGLTPHHNSGSEKIQQMIDDKKKEDSEGSEN